jgi:hypothetical protein
MVIAIGEGMRKKAVEPPAMELALICRSLSPRLRTSRSTAAAAAPYTG